MIDHQNGKTVCPLKVPKSEQCIRFFSCSLFYPYVSVSIIKIALNIYIYLCLTSGSCLLKQQIKSIIAEPTRILTTSHYLFNHQGTCYCRVICRSLENEYFVAKNVRVLDESYLYFPCCKNHHTRLILLSSVLYSLYPFIDSHLSIVLFIHPANPPTHPLTHTSIVGVEKLYIFCILNFWWYHLIQLKIFFLLNVVIPLHVLAFDFSGSWDTRSSFTFMGIGDYVLYKNTERNFEVTCFVLLVAV